MTDAGMLPFTGIEFVVGRAFSAVLAMGTVYQHRENSSGISEKRPLLAVSISWKRCCRYSNVSGRAEVLGRARSLTETPSQKGRRGNHAYSSQ